MTLNSTVRRRYLNLLSQFLSLFSFMHGYKKICFEAVHPGIHWWATSRFQIGVMCLPNPETDPKTRAHETALRRYIRNALAPQYAPGTKNASQLVWEGTSEQVRAFLKHWSNMAHRFIFFSAFLPVSLSDTWQTCFFLQFHSWLNVRQRFMLALAGIATDTPCDVPQLFKKKKLCNALRHAIIRTHTRITEKKVSHESSNKPHTFHTEELQNKQLASLYL